MAWAEFKGGALVGASETDIQTWRGLKFRMDLLLVFQRKMWRSCCVSLLAQCGALF